MSVRGLLSETRGAHVLAVREAGSEEIIDLQDGQRFDAPDLRLLRGGVITGRVFEVCPRGVPCYLDGWKGPPRQRRR